MSELENKESPLIITICPPKDSESLGAVGRALAEHFSKYNDLLKNTPSQTISEGPQREDL